jgi:hypothetical protein
MPTLMGGTRTALVWSQRSTRLIIRMHRKPQPLRSKQYLLNISAYTFMVWWAVTAIFGQGLVCARFAPRNKAGDPRHVVVVQQRRRGPKKLIAQSCVCGIKTSGAYLQQHFEVAFCADQLRQRQRILPRAPDQATRCVFTVLRVIRGYYD